MNKKAKAVMLRVKRLNRMESINEVQEPEYTPSARNPQHSYTDKAFEQMLIDAYFLLKDFPSQIRFSYFVGSNGRLLVKGERKGAK